MVVKGGGYDPPPSLPPCISRGADFRTKFFLRRLPRQWDFPLRTPGRPCRSPTSVRGCFGGDLPLPRSAPLARRPWGFSLSVGPAGSAARAPFPGHPVLPRRRPPAAPPPRARVSRGGRQPIGAGDVRVAGARHGTSRGWAGGGCSGPLVCVVVNSRRVGGGAGLAGGVSVHISMGMHVWDLFPPAQKLSDFLSASPGHHLCCWPSGGRHAPMAHLRPTSPHLKVVLGKDRDFSHG